MDDDFGSTARWVLQTYGAEGGLYIDKTIGDLRRGGDAEMINYWLGVRRAFGSVARDEKRNAPR